VRYDEVVAEFAVIVAEDPKYIYQPSQAAGMCLYVHRTDSGFLEPGCLIGQWLHQSRRVPLAHLAREYEGDGVSEVLTGLIAEGLLPPPKPRDGVVVEEFLAVLQAHQDEGETWVDAFELAQEAALSAERGDADDWE
jgi:hypothetical protein